MTETYYEILGVSRNAPDREIKHAYRILARRLHPDICGEPGATDRFKAINEAYRVLSNRDERHRYDEIGHERYRRISAGLRDPAGSPASVEFRGFSDAFDVFFSERSWGPGKEFRPRGTSDILARMEITLEEAILGGEKTIEVSYASRCTPCRGTGSANGKVRPCPRCGGTGRECVAAPGDRLDPGFPPCRECGGKGRVPEEPCTLCGGWGANQATKRVTVHIPPGIDSGMRIRKDGLGLSVDEEIPDGDLYVEVTILPHARFTREGDDLVFPISLSPARAALGWSTDLVTVDGREIRVEVPPGTPHDGTVRVRGEGVKTRERTGDLILKVKVDVPGNTTAEERKLYRRLVRIEEGRDASKGKGILSRYFPR